MWASAEGQKTDVMIFPAFPRTHLLQGNRQWGYPQWLPEIPDLPDFLNISSSFLNLCTTFPSSGFVSLWSPELNPFPHVHPRPVSLFLSNSSPVQPFLPTVKASGVFSWLWTRTGVSWLFLGTTFPSDVALPPRGGQWNRSLNQVHPSSLALTNFPKLILFSSPTNQMDGAGSQERGQPVVEKVCVLVSSGVESL